jgi:predicted metal-binding membrane protein
MRDSDRPHQRLESLLRRDYAITLVALIAVIIVCWGYLLAGAGMTMPSVGGEETPRRSWDTAYALVMLAMWWVMMIAMMLPSAAPMILVFSKVNRESTDGSPRAMLAFVAAYIAAWSGFSVLATALQWALDGGGLLSPDMASSNRVFGGALLIVAGVWQLTPLKHACLRHCRSPFYYCLHKWRGGTYGAFRMGFGHGAFCLGCCWVLMALLFYGGVMNIWWILGLSTYVLIEKVVPAGHWIGRGTGGLLLFWGIWVLLSV